MKLSERTIDLVAQALRRDGHAIASPALAGPRALDALAGEWGLSRAVMLKGVADAAHMPFADLVTLAPDPVALAALPEGLVRRHRCLPLFLNGRELTVAVGSPAPEATDALGRAVPEFDLLPVLADETLLRALIELNYPGGAEEVVARHLRSADAADGLALRSAQETAPIAQMVDAILQRAARFGASDIHIEPQTDRTVVRLRIDGMLRPTFAFSPTLHEPIISRLKVLAELNVVDRHKPQDGRFTLPFMDRTVEVRLNFLRALHGEKAVLRLAGLQTAHQTSLGTLGLPECVHSRLAAWLAQPHGLILVAGPTGSGKTTTLYACLNELSDPSRNVLTLEDPVESPLTGVTQIMMNPERGVTFATALRAALRQDPDVVMVGEIRDAETAAIAIRGALTGHMLLSTVHANDATETITRLIEMGAEAGNLASALIGVVAQRLVRRLCSCHGYRAARPGEWEALGLPMAGDQVPVPVPRECLACERTGYRGRLALYELLEVDPTVRRLIIQRAAPDALRRAQRALGLRPLLAEGLRAVLAGQTTPEEVLRTVPHPPTHIRRAHGSHSDC